LHWTPVGSQAPRARSGHQRHIRSAHGGCGIPADHLRDVCAQNRLEPPRTAQQRAPNRATSMQQAVLRAEPARYRLVP